MIEEYNETSNTKERIEIIKNNKNNSNYINNKMNIRRNNIIMNILYLILIIIVVIIVIIFLFLYCSQLKKPYIKTYENKNEIICEKGFFLPEDDHIKCIKCSIENCSKCIGNKINNTCNECNSGLYI